MPVGTRVCLYVVLLVNKFHNWLERSKNKKFVVNPSFIVQEKLFCPEEFFL